MLRDVLRRPGKDPALIPASWRHRRLSDLTPEQAPSCTLGAGATAATMPRTGGWPGSAWGNPRGRNQVRPRLQQGGTPI